MKLILCLIVLFYFPTTHARIVSISAEDDWAPWSMRDAKSKQAMGISVDLVRKQFELLNYNVDFKSVPFSRCLIEAELGRTLGCFHTAKTEINKQKFLFPDFPLVEDDVIILYLNSSEKIRSLNDLEGKKLGVTLGYAYSPELDSQKNVIRETCKSDLNLIRMLIARRVPYIAIFKEAYTTIIKENPDLKVESFATFSAGKAQFYLAFSKTYPRSKKILADYNRVANQQIKLNITHK